MKTVYIIHGWDGSPNEPLHQWFKKSLEDQGFKVVIPAMPDPETPRIADWVGKINEIVDLKDDLIFIGHSVGCQAILRYIEKLSAGVKIKGVVLIAPWMELDQETVQEEGEEVVEMARPWMETPIDFSKVKSQAEKFVAIFSDNDPYVPISQKDLFEKELDAEIIIEHDKGHFSEEDNISELPSVLEVIEKLTRLVSSRSG